MVGELLGEFVGRNDGQVDLGTLRCVEVRLGARLRRFSLLPFGKVVSRDAFHAIDFDVEAVAARDCVLDPARALSMTALEGAQRESALFCWQLVHLVDVNG